MLSLLHVSFFISCDWLLKKKRKKCASYSFSFDKSLFLRYIYRKAYSFLFQWRLFMEIDLLLDSLEENMMKTEEALKTSFNALRTGKASPALVENITVDYYGAPTRIRDMANITTPEARLLVIQPWDASAVSKIEKALIASDLGITPVSDGKTLKLPIPALSQDRRQALSKQAKAETEDAKVALRNIRRDGNETAKKAEKNGELTEDELKKMLDDIQKLTDRYIGILEKMLAEKDKDLMTV